MFLHRSSTFVSTGDSSSEPVLYNGKCNLSNCACFLLLSQIHDLPDYYHHTLKFMVGHLKKVADNCDKNKVGVGLVSMDHTFSHNALALVVFSSSSSIVLQFFSSTKTRKQVYHRSHCHIYFSNMYCLSYFSSEHC